MSSIDAHTALLQCNFSPCGAVDMGVITERELDLYLELADEAEKSMSTEKRVRGIDRITIEETDEGFLMVADLAYKGPGTVIITARREKKVWKNLNTLIEYIRSLDSPRTPIQVTLRGQNESSPSKENP